MDFALLLATGLVLGMKHAFDRDHIAAVTHFISLEPDPVKSAWFGFRWAIGHAVSVLALVSILLALHLRFDPAFKRYAELTVGATLIALACWRLELLSREHRHPHQHGPRDPAHSHPHTHEPGQEHVHRFAPTLVGLVHGAAGAVELLVLIPVALVNTAWMAYSYVGLFSLGCAATMSGYGYVVGRVYRRTSHAGRRLYRALVILTSLSGLVLGAMWIARNV